MAPFDRDTTSY